MLGWFMENCLKVHKNSFFGRKQLITPGNLPEGYVTKDLLKNYRCGAFNNYAKKKIFK